MPRPAPLALAAALAVAAAGLSQTLPPPVGNPLPAPHRTPPVPSPVPPPIDLSTPLPVPMPSVPPAPPEPTLEQLTDALERVKAQKAALESQERALAEQVRKRLAAHLERLKRLGVELVLVPPPLPAPVRPTSAMPTSPPALTAGPPPLGPVGPWAFELGSTGTPPK